MTVTIDSCDLDALRDELAEAEKEIERLREALQEVVDHCRNTGHGSPLVDERIVERCEETAVLALKR